MSFDVVITGFRSRSGQTPAAVLEDLFGFEPDKARSLVRSFPSAVIQGTTEAHAQIAAEQLREAGAEVEIRARQKPAALSLNQAADMAKVGAKLLEASPAHAQAQAPASRKVFSTVAMKNIEADLNKFELEGFGPMFKEQAKAASASAFDPKGSPASAFDALDALPFEKPLAAPAKKAAAKAELPDVDSLFEAPPPKQVDRGGFGDDADGGGLDDLFRRPGDEFRSPGSSKGSGRPSSELKAKRPSAQQKGWDTPRQGKGGSGGESKGWDSPSKGVDQGANAAGAAGAEGAKAAGGAAMKAIVAKVAAGVAAVSIAAGASAAVLSSREAAAEAKQAQAAAVKQADGKAGGRVTKLHPAIKLAPAALENSFAGVLRKRVPNTFTVVVEWEGAPDDMQCMLVKKHKAKHAERMVALEQTGKRLEVPPEGQEQLKEHIEGMKAANGTSKAEYEGVCLSVSEHPEGSKPDAEAKAKAEARKRARAEEADEAE